MSHHFSCLADCVFLSEMVVGGRSSRRHPRRRTLLQTHVACVLAVPQSPLRLPIFLVSSKMRV